MATPSGLSALYLRRSDGTADTYYLLRDHLGSTDQVLKAAGSTVVVAESFSAFGARRGSNWSGAPSAADLSVIAATTAEGFTGHDMLDGVGLIHMHGRVYDPTMGRFLSVDPIVRDTAASQSWNGYGYVEGRMLSATDPDGFTTDVNCPSCNKPVEPALERVIVEATRRMAEALRSAEVAIGLDLARLTRPSLGGVPMNEGLETVVVTAKRDKPQENPVKNWLCKAGNSLAEGADMLGNSSGKLELAGLGVALAGTVTAQLEVTAPGLALAATGGVGNIGSGLLQFTAGLFQGAGGGGFSNSGYATLSLATGAVLSRGILGSATSGYRTVSQRASDSFSRGSATVIGGVHDRYTSWIDAATPQQVSCPGGN